MDNIWEWKNSKPEKCLKMATNPVGCHNQRALRGLFEIPCGVIRYRYYADLISLNTLGIRQAAHLTEACVIAHCQQQIEFPVIKIFPADDALQFNLKTAVEPSKIPFKPSTSSGRTGF